MIMMWFFFFLQHPLINLFKTLKGIIDAFPAASGYRVSPEKSIIMDLGVTQEEKKLISQIFPAS